MKSCYWVATFSFSALSLTSCNSVKTPADIGKLTGESVILVSYANKPGQGTGFFVKGEHKSACTVLTARHVIPPNAKLQLQTKDQKIWKDTQITSIKRFPQQDLALLTFKPEGSSCPYKAIAVGNSDKVNIGDNIYITGFPGNGWGRQFVEGKVSLIESRTEGYGISYTAITAGGMSGGPVLNSNGEVIAVHGRTELELAQLAEIQGEQLQPQQQSTTGLSSQNGDAVGTFKWGVPINTYLANATKISTKETVAESNIGNTGTKWTPQTAEQWLILGYDSYASQRYQEALIAYEKVIELQPHNAVAWISIGNLQIRLKRYEDALTALNKGIALNPKSPNDALAWGAKGLALQFLQRYEESLESNKRSIALNSKDINVWINRGFVLEKLRRYEDSLIAYDKAIALDPNVSKIWSNRGTTLWFLQRYKDALASYDKAIALNPKNTDAWYSRGATFDKLGRYSNALASYDKALQVNGGWVDGSKTPADAWLARGKTLRQLKRYSDAIASYNKAIKLNPNYANAWFERGYALNYLQRYEEALAAYNKTITIKPDYYVAWNNKGKQLTHLKRYDEALKAFEKAISINPEKELAVNNRRKLLEMLGRSN
ncbi:MAG: tetratricopeptide repeat-containing serine protease family protein [Cyanobacteria bacterium P01_D01_bin.116]